MGLFKYLIGIVHPKILGDECINVQVKMYEKAKESYPEKDLHYHLAQVWLSRAQAIGENPNDLGLQTLAFTETHIFAHIPPPDCARALGLYFISKERPDIMSKYRIYKEEYERLLRPIHEAEKNGTLDKLYRKYNPIGPEGSK